MHSDGKMGNAPSSLCLSSPVICDVINSEITIPGRCSRHGEPIEPPFPGKSMPRSRRRRSVKHFILNSASSSRKTSHDVCVRYVHSGCRQRLRGVQACAAPTQRRDVPRGIRRGVPVRGASHTTRLSPPAPAAEVACPIIAAATLDGQPTSWRCQDRERRWSFPSPGSWRR